LSHLITKIAAAINYKK